MAEAAKMSWSAPDLGQMGAKAVFAMQMCDFTPACQSRVPGLPPVKCRLTWEHVQR